MLKDPNFNVKELTLRNLEKGVAFSEYYFTSPIDNRELPTVVGATIPMHPKWSRSVSEKSHRMMLAAKHATGIYLGYPLNDAIDMFSSTDVLCDYPTFDIATGEWYSREELSEHFNRFEFDDPSPLSTGKRRPSGNIADSYGLADNISQILKFFRKVMTRRDYDVVLHLNHHTKNENSGLRWHKQGRYLGNYNKKCEYIFDEVGLESIIQYHFYVIK